MGAQRTGEGEREMGLEREKCPGNTPCQEADIGSGSLGSPVRGAVAAGD